MTQTHDGVVHDDPNPPPIPLPPDPPKTYAELIAYEPDRLAATKPLLAETLAAVANPPTLIADFYRRLFDRHPEVRGMFPDDMTKQREKLLNAVIALAGNVDNLGVLMPALEGMGRAHARFDIGPVHFDIVGGLLLEVLAEHAATVWTGRHARAWTVVYGFASGVMLANIHAVRERRAA